MFVFDVFYKPPQSLEDDEFGLYVNIYLNEKLIYDVGPFESLENAEQHLKLFNFPITKKSSS